MKAAGVVLVIIFGLLLVAWTGTRAVQSIVFDRNCGGHLKRAADANTVELATKEMETVVHYAEREGITSGYTSVIYRTPDEDVGFWYDNMRASLMELKDVKPDATQLEKSNVLIKLRETLLDHGRSTSITAPESISIFPYNVLYAVWGTLSLILVIVGLLLIAVSD